MSVAEGRSVIVFLCHTFSPSIAGRFARLRGEMQGTADVRLLLQDDGGPVVAQWTRHLADIGAGEALSLFAVDRLPAILGYDFGTREKIMGSTQFPLLAFARDHACARYWLVEGDVELRGRWTDFFAAFDGSDAPVLASHTHRFEEWPSWNLWASVRAPAGARLRRTDLRKAFFPVARYTAAALRAIEEVYRAGWRGHFEAIVPTGLHLAGVEVRDLRAHLRCYVGEFQNPALVALQSTMRWRPPVAAAEFLQRGEGPLLFHPVKADWFYDGDKIIRFEPAAAAQ